MLRGRSFEKYRDKEVGEEGPLEWDLNLSGN